MEYTVKKKSKNGLKRADFYLITGLLIVTSVLLVVIQFGMKKPGEKVIVKVDGNVVKKISLNENIVFDIEGYQGGSNRIVVEDGNVAMSDADCPDKLCVHTGKIKKTGETIVCLPHRVVVEITGDGKEYDAVVQ